MDRRTFLCGLTLGALGVPLAPFEGQQATPVIGYLSQMINMRTARALGLTIPPSLLLRADRVIQDSP